MFFQLIAAVLIGNLIYSLFGFLMIDIFDIYDDDETPGSRRK